MLHPGLLWLLILRSWIFPGFFQVSKCKRDQLLALISQKERNVQQIAIQFQILQRIADSQLRLFFYMIS